MKSMHRFWVAAVLVLAVCAAVVYLRAGAQTALTRQLRSTEVRSIEALADAESDTGGLFRPAAALAARAASDSLALRSRLVSIDFKQLPPPTGGGAVGAAAPGRELRLNLFADALFTGLVERVEPTFSGGYALSGPLSGVAMGTMTLVVNDAVVVGTVRTPGAIYRIHPAADGLHAVSQVDLSRRPPLGEPIPRPRPEEAGLPIGLDGDRSPRFR